MEIEEINVGDWVKEIYKGIDGNIYEQEKKVSIPDLNDVKNFKPIPITTEILEKNGFKDYGKGVFKLNIQGKNKCIEIFFNDDDISLIIINTRIDKLNVRVTFESSYAMIDKSLYVHELQHALRLCKINKEVIL